MTDQEDYPNESLRNDKPNAPKPELHELLKNKPYPRDVQALIDKFPDAVREVDELGRLPLHTAVFEAASVKVIRVLLKADSSAAKKTMKVEKTFRSYEYKDNFEDMLPLHFAITETKSCSPGLVKALLYAYPKGAETSWCGKLPLGLSLLRTDGVSDEVVLALLAFYPDAAKESVTNDSSLLPLHSAIKGAHSLELVKALLDAYPGGVEVMFDGLLPLGLALQTYLVSDDVVLAILAAFPDAAKVKVTLSNESSVEILPLHFAMEGKRSQKVLDALLHAYHGAEQEENPFTNIFLLHTLVKTEPNAKDVQALIDKYPDAVREIGTDGMLPLHAAACYCASVEVIRVLLKANPSAAKKTKVEKTFRSYEHEDNFEDMLPLHIAITVTETKSWSLGVVKVLLDAYPKGAEARTAGGELPLSMALQHHFGLLDDDVVLAILEAYPDGAKDADASGRLPLHLAILRKRSLLVVKALLRAHPEGTKARFNGKLPLSMALTIDGVSDDVVLAILAAYPDAAKDKYIRCMSLDAATTGKRVSKFYPLLALHFAILEKRSQVVVKALINAYPGALKERHPDTKNLLLRDAINMKASEEIILILVNAYPEAAKKKMLDGRLPIEACTEEKDLALFEMKGNFFRDALDRGINRMKRKEEFEVAKAMKEPNKMNVGRLPIEACAENKASEDLMLALLEADMPLRRDGMPVDHGGSWTACVAANTDGAAGAVRRILSPESEGGGGFGVHIRALAAVCDAEGRTALGLASSGPRVAIYEYLLFSRRYELQDGAPEHRTKTSVVLRAQDIDERADYGAIFDEADKDKDGKLDRLEISTVVVSKIGLDPALFLKGSDESIKKEDFVGICKRQLGDGPRNVVIKLMQKKDHWERECNARKEYNLDPKYVVSMLPNIPSENDIAEAVKKGDGGLKFIVEKFLDGIEPGKYAIVMDAADRNLHQIFYQEQPTIDAVRDMLRQVFEAVKHLHGKNLMHGDLKMLNIVRSRIDNQLRLIDFDASAKIVPIGGQGESFAGAKFSSAILPPEMIERIETEEQLEKFNEYWEGENDKSLVAKVAPMLYEEQGIVKSRYIVKSFRTKEGGPVYEGLPYDLVKASENIDAWALGVLAFTLLTGKTLIPSTRDDDCDSGAAMHVLYTWGTKPEVMIDLFKKIHDDAARDLVRQLLQYEPEKRPTVASLLETHSFFHPMSLTLLDKLEDLDNAIQNETKQRQDDRALLEIMNANIVVIKKLGTESKAEQRRTCHVLLKGIFEATEVSIPTTFIVLNDKLPPKPSEEEVNKILHIVAAEDGSGVRVESKYASVTLSADGADIDLEGDLKERYDLGMKWVKCIKSVAAKVAAGEAATVEAAFETIKDGIKDLIVEKKMYLYLIDELTGEPVRAKGWPIKITKPSKIVPKLLPLMQVGMRAMSIYNGAAGVARMFGYPVPKVPKAWSEGAQESVELLKQESSVEQFAVVHAEVKKDTEEKKSVRGVSLREFMDFMGKNDPGLKVGKNGDFAGLQRIGDPEDGTALWTTLTDQVDIEDALEKRAKQRRDELLKQNEHIQKMARAGIEERGEKRKNPAYEDGWTGDEAANRRRTNLWGARWQNPSTKHYNTHD